MKIIVPTIVALLLLGGSPVLADDDLVPNDDLQSIDYFLEGLPDEPPAKQTPDEQPAKEQKPFVFPGEDIGEDIGAPSEDANPLAGIGRQMRDVQKRIDGGDTASETQFMQKQIVSDLDKLLEQLNKQCNGGQCNNPSQNAASKPGAGKPKGGNQPGQASNRPNAQGSEEGTRKAEGVDETAADPRTVVREAWGHLPQRLREQVQAAAFERFLPQYESLIEAYYERLAEENSEP